MGNYKIVIAGTGQNSNNHENDIEKLAAKFVADVKALGHKIEEGFVHFAHKVENLVTGESTPKPVETAPSAEAVAPGAPAFETQPQPDIVAPAAVVETPDTAPAPVTEPTPEPVASEPVAPAPAEPAVQS